MKPSEIPVEVYVVKVTLLGTSPPVWRRILVPRKITLRNLHRTLQTVMGWTNSHLHQFILPRQKFFDPRHRVGTKVADESRTRLGDLIWTAGAKLLYEYDFGDGWQHELLLEKVLLGDESFRQLCVAGDRNCPPEDCGGSTGFSELVKALQDSTHPEHDDIREWVGDFVPESFSADEINRRLRRRKH
ncbi:MAG: plasmid pRiA4b ORF-3 family protein [Terriglobales bacterium]